MHHTPARNTGARAPHPQHPACLQERLHHTVQILDKADVLTSAGLKRAPAYKCASHNNTENHTYTVQSSARHGEPSPGSLIRKTTGFLSQGRKTICFQAKDSAAARMATVHVLQ